MTQRLAMLKGAANDWFERNRAKLGQSDPVSDIIAQCRIKPTAVCEVGCANGWRLAKLHAAYHCGIYGVEPSDEAVRDADRRGVVVKRGTADHLPFDAGSFDLLIYGFCLYLADPGDLLKIAAEGDRVLRQGGHLIVHDFAVLGLPFRRSYKHAAGVWSYHLEFTRLWLASPQYRGVAQKRDGEADVTVLQKVGEVGWEVRE